MNRTVGYTQVEDGFVSPTTVSENLLLGKVSLNPEAAAFLFSLEGCRKRLLLYILFFELDTSNLLFKVNSQVIQSFQEYCLLFRVDYQKNIIMKALRELVEQNVITNISRGNYMLNPLVTGGTKTATQRQLIADYSKILIDKSKDAEKLFHPRYYLKKKTKKATHKKK